MVVEAKNFHGLDWGWVPTPMMGTTEWMLKEFVASTVKDYLEPKREKLTLRRLVQNYISLN